MYRRPFSKEHKAFIKSNYLKISSRNIAQELGCSKGKVLTFLKDNKMIVPEKIQRQFRRDALKGKTSFTEEQTEFLKAKYLEIPVKRIAIIIGLSHTCVRIRMQQLGLVVPPEIIDQRKKKNLFKKGSIPFNKGKKQTEYMSDEAIEKSRTSQFKKGNVPHNTKFNGHERITKDGYVEIRVLKGKYRLKHLVNWEKEKGDVPEGYCLCCVDGNKLNVGPDNWELITREENMLRNSKHNIPKEFVRTMAIRSKINKKIKSIENGKK